MPKTSVHGAQIREETVTADQIKDGSVISDDLSNELNDDIQAPLVIGDGIQEKMTVDLHETLHIIGQGSVTVAYDDVENKLVITGQAGSFQNGSNISIHCGAFNEPNAKIHLGTF